MPTFTEAVLLVAMTYKIGEDLMENLSVNENKENEAVI